MGLCLFLQVLLVSSAVTTIFEFSTANILPLLVGLLYGYVYYHDKKIGYTKKEDVCSLILGGFFSICIVMGKIEAVLRYDGKFAMLLSLGVSLVGMGVLFKVIIGQILYLLRKDSIVLAGGKEKRYPAKYVYCGALLVLLLCWGLSFAIAYPGDFTWDSSELLQQALGHIRMDVLYPLYMTLQLRLCWNLGYMIWGDENAGVALYLVVQMILVAVAMAYVVYRLYSLNVKKQVCIIVLLYYAVVPFNAHYSHTLWKDIPFSICTVIFVLLLWEYLVLDVPLKLRDRIIKGCIFFLSGLGMALSRTNGLYAFIFFLPFGILLFWKHKKTIAISLVLLFLSVKLVQGPIYGFILTQNNQYVDNSKYPPYDIRYADKIESVVQNTEQAQAELSEHQQITDFIEQDVVQSTENTEAQVVEQSVEQTEEASASQAATNYASTGIYIMTIQQFGRLVTDRELSEEELAELDVLFDVQRMKEEYDKHIANNALGLIRWGNASTGEYLKVWIKYGIRYPYSYFIGWRDQTIGYWYPDIQYGAVADYVFSEVEGIYRDSPFSDKVTEGRRSIDGLSNYIPIYGLLWSIGFVVWLTFLSIGLTVCKKGIMRAFIYLPFIGVWLTLLVATPVFAEFRYIYCLFAGLPLILLIPFIDKEPQGKPR